MTFVFAIGEYRSGRTGIINVVELKKTANKNFLLATSKPRLKERSVLPACLNSSSECVKKTEIKGIKKIK
jgi:hypothetical protein